MLVECKHCEAIVDGQVLHHYESHDPEAGDYRYTFVKCPRCESPMVTEEKDYGTGWFPPSRLYPAQGKSLDPMIPGPIQAAFLEAQACLKAKANTAAAVMCRKTLEGICKAHGSQARQLVDALKELKNNGTIESRLFDWADLLRIAGNEAAHDVDIQIAAEDAHDLVEFTGALLDYVFSFRERFEKFKNRKSERDAAKLGPITKGG